MGRLAFLQLPAVKGAELQMTFGNVTRLVATITASDQDATRAWLERAGQMLEQGKASIGGDETPLLQEGGAMRPLADALLDAGLHRPAAPVRSCPLRPR